MQRTKKWDERFHWLSQPWFKSVVFQWFLRSRIQSFSAFLTTSKPLTVCITTNCGKFLERWEYKTTLPASWETCMQVRKQQLELDMEQIEKGVCQGCILSPCLFNLYVEHIMGNAGLEWSTSWNQDYQEKYQSPQICKWHYLYGRKWRGTKASWWKWKRRVKKLA